MTKKQTPPTKPIIMTVGHSTRSYAALVELLHANGVTMLIDIRTIPKSATNRQTVTHLLRCFQMKGSNISIWLILGDCAMQKKAP